jgi:hypothetical protein
MVPIESLDQLREELKGLMAMGAVRASGDLARRGIEVDHALYSDNEPESKFGTSSPAAAAGESPAAEPQPRSVARPDALDTSDANELQAAVQQLQEAQRQLQDENRELSQLVEQLQERLRDVADQLDDLKQQLGV